MNKAELISRAAASTGSSKKETGIIIDALIKIMTDTLSEHEKIQLVGFGVFEVKQKSQRSGINPQTFEKITIPESTTVTFKPGKYLKESIEKNENR